MADPNMERTYIMIKPDGVQRGLVGKIIERFETRGYHLQALKLCAPSREHLEAHYADLKTKKFFPGLIDYMASGPVVSMVRAPRRCPHNAAAPSPAPPPPPPRPASSPRRPRAQR